MDEKTFEVPQVRCPDCGNPLQATVFVVPDEGPPAWILVCPTEASTWEWRAV